MKLTNPQKELLRDVRDQDGSAVSDSYKPAMHLIALGLCEWQQRKYSKYLVITEAGKAALEGQKP